MPTIPTYVKCKHLGCKNEKAKMSGYCIEHGGRNYPKPTQERKDFNSMYHSAYWRKQKALQLSKHPLCQACLIKGIVNQAQHIDHVFSWRYLGKEAFRRNLFQSLCASCHTLKTQKEAEGLFIYYSKERAIEYRLSDYPSVMSSLF